MGAMGYCLALRHQKCYEIVTLRDDRGFNTRQLRCRAIPEVHSPSGLPPPKNLSRGSTGEPRTQKAPTARYWEGPMYLRAMTTLSKYTTLTGFFVQRSVM